MSQINKRYLSLERKVLTNETEENIKQIVFRK